MKCTLNDKVIFTKLNYMTVHEQPFCGSNPIFVYHFIVSLNNNNKI